MTSGPGSRRPGRPRRRGAAAALVAAVCVLTACTGGSAPGDGAAAPSGPFELPFGLQPVDGTTSLGRPADRDTVLYEFAGAPVTGRRVQAAYLVTSPDPVEVFQQWLDQLTTLPLDEIGVGPGILGTAQWLTALGSDRFQGDRPYDAAADLQLWATADGPVLLVDISVVADGGERPQAVAADRVPPPDLQVEGPPPGSGEALFTEKGTTLHVPVGARALFPTLPTPGGTGGSTSIVLAPDGEAAVRAMLAEAQAGTTGSQVTGPTTQVQRGARVTSASFEISAGGWSFEVVAVQGSDDTSATLFVTSAAD